MKTPPTQNPQDMVLSLVDKILQAGNRAHTLPLDTMLETLQTIIRKFPQLLWSHPHIWKLAKAYAVMYHYDVREDEDENITLIEHAYIFAQRVIDLYEKSDSHKVTREDYFAAMHTQVMLLSTCGDCYIPELSNLYTQEETESQSESYTIARQLSYTMLEYIQYAIIDKITEQFDGLGNDEFLEHRCHEIEMEHENLSQKRIEYAHKVNKRMIYGLQKRFVEWAR